MIDKILEAAEKRASHIPEDTTCFRVVDAEGDSCPGLWLDWLDGRLLFQTKEGTSISTQQAKAIAEALQAKSVYRKRLDQHEKESPQWLYGERVDQPFIVLENGINYELAFNSGYSQGIFLDQRNNRQQVLERVIAAPIDSPRVLNLFAYTCAFSVAAAMGGAITTSVDLSAGYLDWGRRNFALNDIDHKEHFFVKGDAFDWLQAFAKKGRKWQGIVLDPPTFSRGEKKKIFRVERDYAELVKLAMLVLEPNGWLLCCANTRTVSASLLGRQVRDGAAEAHRRITNFRSASMPSDFTAEPYLKSFWLDVV